jgi:hypothetical protein
MINFLYEDLSDDSFDPKRPCEPIQRFRPQPMIVTLGHHRRIGRDLAFAPQAQHPSVCQIDAPFAVERVEAPDHVIRLAGAAYRSLTGRIPRALTPGDEGGHRPHPGVFGGFERLGPRLLVWRGTVGGHGLSGVMHEWVPTGWDAMASGHVTTGCIQRQEKWLFFLFPSAAIPRIIIQGRFPPLRLPGESDVTRSRRDET